MGLAPLGKPNHLDKMQKLVRLQRERTDRVLAGGGYCRPDAHQDGRPGNRQLPGEKAYGDAVTITL
jgi:hypothetical protein